jgi:hypothetical protein
MRERVDTLLTSPVDLDRWALIGISAPAVALYEAENESSPP